MSKAQDLAPIMAVIASVGGVVDRHQYGKHHKIYWRIGEKQFVTSVSKTPSDWRAERNKIAQIKALARAAHSEVSYVA